MQLCPQQAHLERLCLATLQGPGWVVRRLLAAAGARHPGAEGSGVSQEPWVGLVLTVEPPSDLEGDEPLWQLAW